MWKKGHSRRYRLQILFPAALSPGIVTRESFYLFSQTRMNGRENFFNESYIAWMKNKLDTKLRNCVVIHCYMVLNWSLLDVWYQCEGESDPT